MNDSELEKSLCIKEDINLEKDMGIIQDLTFRFYLFVVCVYNTIKANIIIVLILFVAAFLLTIEDFVITNTIAGAVWSILATLILVEPISFYNNEKRYFKITYATLMQVNMWVGVLLDFAQNTLKIEDINIDDLYFGAHQMISKDKNAEKLKLDIYKKYILLDKVRKKLFSDEYKDKELDDNLKIKYKKMQELLGWRVDSLFEDLEFHAYKNISVLNLFNFKCQKRFLMPEKIETYGKLGQQYSLLAGAYERIYETNFLEPLFDSYMYFSKNRT